MAIRSLRLPKILLNVVKYRGFQVNFGGGISF